MPYRFATGITELLAEGADVDDEHYDPVEFERRWTNADSNRLMMAKFDRLAWETYQELAPGQSPGPDKRQLAEFQQTWTGSISLPPIPQMGGLLVLHENVRNHRGVRCRQS